MCFSATASFTAAGVLTVLGGAAIARGSNGPYRIFAATPLLFAAQQAAEGVVWLTIHDPGAARASRIAVSVFLGLALVIWPVWLSFSLRFGEKNPQRRRVLTGMLVFGAMVSVAALLLMSRSQPMAVVAQQSIRYDRAGTTNLFGDLLVLLAYFTAAVAPLFVSTVTLGRTIGVLLLGSLILAAVIEHNSITSVWCFFAAILSGLVVFAVGLQRQAPSVAASA